MGSWAEDEVDYPLITQLCPTKASALAVRVLRFQCPVLIKPWELLYSGILYVLENEHLGHCRREKLQGEEGPC